MDRKTKHLLEIDPKVLLTALQNERDWIVRDVRRELQKSLDSLHTANAIGILPDMADRIIDMQVLVGKLDNAIAELKEQTGMDDVLERSINDNFSPDDIDDIPF